MDTKNTKITKWSHAYKDYTSACKAEILNYFNSELQLKDAEFTIKNKLIDSLSELRGFKFVTTLVLEFKKIEINNKTKYSSFCLNSKSDAIINESNIDDALESIYVTIIWNIKKIPGKGSCWIIDSVIYHITVLLNYQRN